MEERWTGLIYNGEDYSNKFIVSDTGKLKSIISGKILKLQKNSSGYLNVVVSFGAKNKKIIKIHKAVLERSEERRVGKECRL